MSLELVFRDRARTHGTHDFLFEVYLVVRGSVRDSVELDVQLRKLFLELHRGVKVLTFLSPIFLSGSDLVKVLTFLSKSSEPQLESNIRLLSISLSPSMFLVKVLTLFWGPDSAPTQLQLSPN